MHPNDKYDKPLLFQLMWTHWKLTGLVSIRNKANPSDNDWLKLLRSDKFQTLSGKLSGI